MLVNVNVPVEFSDQDIVNVLNETSYDSLKKVIDTINPELLKTIIFLSATRAYNEDPKIIEKIMKPFVKNKQNKSQNTKKN
jgi:hypothetical protein